MMLDKSPLFHAAAVESAERVSSELQSPAYWEQSNYSYMSSTRRADYF